MESEAKRIKRASQIIQLLYKNYPHAECALHHKNPFELLVATILSAQCTDERVNKVTPALFARFPHPQAMSEAEITEIEELIRSTGFYKNKAKNILACSQALMRDHQGNVPQSMEELVKLSGVGRKTANVVLGNAFSIASGVVVDTHVGRLSYRMGLTSAENPEIIERNLMSIVPRKDWTQFAHLMIHHGRQVCTARSPKCDQCFLSDLCPQRMK